MVASEDGADVATPVSLTEWFVSFYEQAKSSKQMRECMVKAGELLFIPRGWWHLALNLEVYLDAAHAHYLLIPKQIVKHSSGHNADL